MSCGVRSRPYPSVVVDIFSFSRFGWKKKTVKKKLRACGHTHAGNLNARRLHWIGAFFTFIFSIHFLIYIFIRATFSSVTVHSCSTFHFICFPIDWMEGVRAYAFVETDFRWVDSLLWNERKNAFALRDVGILRLAVHTIFSIIQGADVQSWSARTERQHATLQILQKRHCARLPSPWSANTDEQKRNDWS